MVNQLPKKANRKERRDLSGPLGGAGFGGAALGAGGVAAGGGGAGVSVTFDVSDIAFHSLVVRNSGPGWPLAWGFFSCPRKDVNYFPRRVADGR